MADNLIGAYWSNETADLREHLPLLGSDYDELIGYSSVTGKPITLGEYIETLKACGFKFVQGVVSRYNLALEIKAECERMLGRSIPVDVEHSPTVWGRSRIESLWKLWKAFNTEPV